MMLDVAILERRDDAPDRREDERGADEKVGALLPFCRLLTPDRRLPPTEQPVRQQGSGSAWLAPIMHHPPDGNRFGAWE